MGIAHREDARVVAIPFQPGSVHISMGEPAAEMAGMDEGQVPVTVEESVNGLIATFDKATKREHSGKFFDQNGPILAC
jgi:hypothetical protein